MLSVAVRCRHTEGCALVRDALEQLKRMHPLEGSAWEERVSEHIHPPVHSDWDRQLPRRPC